MKQQRARHSALTFSVLACVMALPAMSETICWNRDRSGAYPEANPPFSFDGAAGTNIVWKTRLPNWSNGGPIVHNGKVFCMAEPVDSYRPTITCIDAVSGRILWQHELDAVGCFPTSQQDEVRRFAEEMWAWQRRLEALWSEAYFLHKKHGKQFDGWDRPPASIALRWKQIAQEVESLGADWRPFRARAGGDNAKFHLPRRGKAQQRLNRLADLALTWDYVWRGFGTWTGIAFPTPCSDGDHVYTMTAHNHFACFTHEGKLVWQRRFPRTKKETVPEAYHHRLPEKRWSPSWPGQPCFPTSPVLADGVLLSCAGYMLRGLDARTGRELWCKPYLKHLGQGMGIPAIVRVDGEALMIAVGHESRHKVHPGDEIVRVRDGRTVGYLPGSGTSKGPGAGPIVVADDLVVTERHLDRRRKAMAAYRLSWKVPGRELQFTEVWSHDRDTKLPRHFNMFRRGCWLDGLGYAGTAVMDLRTGTIVRDHGRAWRVNQGYTGHGGIIVGPAYCRWDFYGDKKVSRKMKTGNATFHFFDRKTGKKLGVGRLPVHPDDGLPQAQQQAEEHRHKRWRWLGGATPYAVGGRLYIRSYDFLWCIGKQ